MDNEDISPIFNLKNEKVVKPDAKNVLFFLDSKSLYLNLCLADISRWTSKKKIRKQQWWLLSARGSSRR